MTASNICVAKSSFSALWSFNFKVSPPFLHKWCCSLEANRFPRISIFARSSQTLWLIEKSHINDLQLSLCWPCGLLSAISLPYKNLLGKTAAIHSLFLGNSIFYCFHHNWWKLSTLQNPIVCYLPLYVYYSVKAAKMEIIKSSPHLLHLMSTFRIYIKKKQQHTHTEVW